MRRIVLFVLLVAASSFLVGAPAAQASPACVGTPQGPWCDWINNGKFELGTSSWNFQNNAVVIPAGELCSGSGPYAARVGQRDSISQRMNIWAGYGPKFTLYFDLHLFNSGGTVWDSLDVTVRDLNTGSVERWQYNGWFTSRCSIEKNLVNNYSGHMVEVSFTGGYALYPPAYFLVDDVQFWSRP